MQCYDSRILCVDSDARTLDWIDLKLKGAGLWCVTTSTSTGREAFNLLNEQNFDLCILDYALPDMTGVQLCALMHSLRIHVPFLFFSAMNRPVDREKAVAAGAVGYLCKPDDLEVFVDAVTHQLDKRRITVPEKDRYLEFAKAA